MMRTARVAWLGHPPAGHGRVSVGAHAFSALPLSFAGEGREPEAEATTPGELLAAAHASAIATVLARILEEEGTPARELVVTAQHAFAGEWYELKAVQLAVRGRVDGLEAAAFVRAVADAAARCSASVLLPTGDALSIETELA